MSGEVGLVAIAGQLVGKVDCGSIFPSGYPSIYRCFLPEATVHCGGFRRTVKER